MRILWLLNAFVVFFVTVYSWEKYWKRRTIFHLLFFTIFLELSIGYSCICYFYRSGLITSVMVLLWSIMTLLTLLLLIPIFYKYFFILAGDRGGFSIEAGIIVMVLGLMLTYARLFEYMPLVAMISSVVLYMGYNRIIHQYAAAICQ